MLNNLVFLKGIMHDVPEVSKTPDDKDSAKFTILVTEKYFDNETNEWKTTEATLCSCVAFNAQAIAETRHLRRGSPVNATGKLKQHKYKDMEGELCNDLEIVITHLEEICRPVNSPGDLPNS